MIDLTKEDFRVLWYLTPANHYPALKEKLQSLIDNYCGHEFNVGSNSVVITGDALKHFAGSKHFAIGYGAKVTAAACKHEWDGYAYAVDYDGKICTGYGTPCRYKCKKCGEFYL